MCYYTILLKGQFLGYMNANTELELFTRTGQTVFTICDPTRANDPKGSLRAISKLTFESKHIVQCLRNILTQK